LRIHGNLPRSSRGRAGGNRTLPGRGRIHGNLTRCLRGRVAAGCTAAWSRRKAPSPLVRQGRSEGFSEPVLAPAPSCCRTSPAFLARDGRGRGFVERSVEPATAPRKSPCFAARERRRGCPSLRSGESPRGSLRNCRRRHARDCLWKSHALLAEEGRAAGLRPNPEVRAADRRSTCGSAARRTGPLVRRGMVHPAPLRGRVGVRSTKRGALPLFQRSRVERHGQAPG